MAQRTIVLAGATGDLGARIARDLIARGAAVRALVRPELSGAGKDHLAEIGAVALPVNPTDISSVASVCAGAACVVSALNGLHDVIVDRQGVLLDAAVRAGVPRFISSDFSADFTKTRPGNNRNLDLRREFMIRANRAPIEVTSILNGAFLDMLGAEMPIIQPSIRRVLYWGDATQQLDFTTKDDVAAFTALAALDRTTPRILRIAGDSVTVRDIADVASDVTGQTYRPLWAGSIGLLGLLIRIAKLIAPKPGTPFPPWQGMQYMRDMFSGRGRLDPLDNDRYPTLTWTSVREQLGTMLKVPEATGRRNRG